MNYFKKITLGVLLSAQVLGAFYGCSSDVSDLLIEQKKKSTSSVTSRPNYQNIGNLHNDGLEYVYSEIMSKKEFHSMNLSDMLNEVKKGTYNFTNRLEFSAHVSYPSYLSIYELYDSVLYSQLDEIKRGDYDFNMVDSIKSFVNLTHRQEKYLSMLDAIISEYEPNNIHKIYELEKEIVSNCNEDELYLLLVSTSIAVNSIEYWGENLDKWMSIANRKYDTILVNNRKKKSNEDWKWFKSTIKSMGKSDVVGGAIGAGVGAMAGGVGAAPGAVGGACYSSAGRAIVALTERWGLW